MTASDRDKPDLLVDTSVAIAVAVSDHEHHDATFQALADRRLGLAGHAAFESFSVLTRLPPPARRTPSTVARLLAATFPHSRFLSSRGATSLLARLESLGIAGGSIYDALVGAAAAEHRITLATRDLRALGTYRALDVEIALLP
ncbi:MAG: type II toxin-antitoxin system VapC family toxin [Thermoleophilaceae bacterium]|nr:type II toxin-antitoxin system VapC family toxin [Thermoleophilaceae bacterium]